MKSEKAITDCADSADSAEYDLTTEEAQRSQDLYPVHLDTALAYVGVTEVGGDNRGPEVERFLASVGLGPGYAWCAAQVSFSLEQSPDRIDFPEVRSALATDFITRKSIKASSVLMGIEEPPVGSVVIWRKGNGIFGHAGFLVDDGQLLIDDLCENRGNCFVTVEGNTGPEASTNGADVERERNGDGVYVRIREIQPGNYFRIVSFTPVIYE